MARLVGATRRRADVRQNDHAEGSAQPTEVARPVPSEGALSRATRRLLDIVVAIAVLIFSAPLLTIVGLLIRLDSPGPAIFRQERVGRNRRRVRDPHYRGPERRVTRGFGPLFRLWKFRSMYIDARERFPESYDYNHSPEALQTLPMKALMGPRTMVRAHALRGADPDHNVVYTPDPRVTRLGHWVRKTSIDELLNFWNVLKGEMTIVGPRPELPQQALLYKRHQLRKFDVKPGVTGLPQIRGLGALTFMQTQELDLEYVEKRSLAYDWGIILRTLKEALKGYGT